MSKQCLVSQTVAHRHRTRVPRGNPPSGASRRTHEQFKTHAHMHSIPVTAFSNWHIPKETFSTGTKNISIKMTPEISSLPNGSPDLPGGANNLTKVSRTQTTQSLHTSETQKIWSLDSSSRHTLLRHSRYGTYYKPAINSINLSAAGQRSRNSRSLGGGIIDLLSICCPRK